MPRAGSSCPGGRGERRFSFCGELMEQPSVARHGGWVTSLPFGRYDCINAAA